MNNESNKDRALGMLYALAYSLKDEFDNKQRDVFDDVKELIIKIYGRDEKFTK